MIKIISNDNEDQVEEINKINLNKDVVFCSPSDNDIISFSSDGKIYLTMPNTLNISMIRQSFNPDMREYSFVNNLKISYPTGILPSFINDTAYTDVCLSFNKYSGIILDDPSPINMNNIDFKTSNESYHVIDQLKFRMIFNLYRMRETNPLQVITEHDPIATITLNRVFTGNEEMKFNNIYYIQNDFVYEKFTTHL